MKEKVIIEISNKSFDGTPCKFAKSVFNGVYFTSVHFNARNYGASSPCINEEEIKSSIKHHSEWIKKEGDIPVIKDLRVLEVQHTLF